MHSGASGALEEVRFSIKWFYNINNGLIPKQWWFYNKREGNARSGATRGASVGKSANCNINAKNKLNSSLKMQRWWRVAPKNDDFCYKNDDFSIEKWPIILQFEVEYGQVVNDTAGRVLRGGVHAPIKSSPNYPLICGPWLDEVIADRCVITQTSDKYFVETEITPVWGPLSWWGDCWPP